MLECRVAQNRIYNTPYMTVYLAISLSKYRMYTEYGGFGQPYLKGDSRGEVVKWTLQPTVKTRSAPTIIIISNNH
jgi:hypothetical protein